MGLEITTPGSGGLELEGKTVTVGGEVRVKNSDESFDETYTPDDSPITLSNINHTDSDGETVSHPANKPFVATACVATKSITLAFSDANPNLGDNNTITVTTENFDNPPTSYTFYLPRIDGTYKIVTQASNTYVWPSEGNGEVEVTVSATNGTETAHGCAMVDVVFPFVYNEFSGMASSYGFFKANSAYTGNWAQFQRTYDGAYLEVGWINGCVADINSLRNWAGFDEVKLTIMYDSTGNGNHVRQTASATQHIISNGGGLRVDDTSFFTTDNNRLVMDGAGTASPFNQSTLDIYTYANVKSSSPTDRFFLLFNKSANSGWMLRGQSGSTFTGISDRFGSPSFYLDGAASGWSTLGDVYTDLYENGTHQITIIGGDTTNAAWSRMWIGEIDFGLFWEGGIGTIWMWVDDTSPNRANIESRISALNQLDIIN